MRATFGRFLRMMFLAVFINVIGLPIVMPLRFAYSENLGVPTQSFTGVVLEVNNKIVHDPWWKGTFGFCTLTIKTSKGVQLTVSPNDWQECIPIAKGDRIKIWRQRDQKWRVTSSVDILR